jgi:phosphoribosylamine--glycine ligase
MGDPETQVVFPRINSDLLKLLEACARGNLKACELEIDPAYAVTVVMVAGGYPEVYDKGDEIKGLADVPPELVVVHAGTKQDEYHILTNGGRVLSVTAQGDTLDETLHTVYDGLQYISWNNSYYRKDIGKDLLAYHLD